MILFPMLVRNQVIKRDSRRMVSASMLLCFGLTAAIALMFAVIARPLIEVLRPEYVGAAALVPYYAMAMGMFTTASQALNFALARDDMRVAYLMFAAALVQCVCFWFLHTSFDAYITIMLISSALLVTVNLLLVWIPPRGGRPAVQPGGVPVSQRED
jgi:O-antigen/teichoic acid export membrane protein